jgi:inner membrane transporter RhtA
VTAAAEVSSSTCIDTRGPARAQRKRRAGVLAMLTGAVGSQTGAAVGAHAFPAIGPAGVVAVRQLVAAVVLLSVARPSLRQLTWRQWWPCLVLAAVFATMNLSLYSAIERVGLGLAVTLEFLGPLAIALIGSRGLRDLALALIAAIGVYVLVLPGPSSDFVGLTLGLLAATCWALYIVANRVAGQRLPGLQAPAVGSMVSATIYLPVLILLALDGALSGLPVLMAIAAGVLSSAVPYAADLTALRFIPQRFFGVFMSVNPVLAALAGMLLLGQDLALHEWLGIAIVVTANVFATLRQRQAP